jgi:hypothetical protein
LTDNLKLDNDGRFYRGETKRDPTCAERIADYMAGRAETIGALQDVADSGREDGADEYGYPLTADDADERLAEMPLSVEVVRHVKILFGTGGPADWLDATLYDDGSVRSLEYTFQDWFDSASVAVESDSPLWRYAESVAELMAESEAVR